MPGYIQLCKLTQEGIKNLTEKPSTIKDTNAKAEEMGIRVIGVWMTMGEYDVVAVLDAPDDQTVAAWAFYLGSSGTISTQTMRALSEEEFAQAVSKMP